jgi:hypothetical protein
MTTPAQAPASTQTRQRQVGIWGATASGKSTFLSSLFIAASRFPDHLMVRGNNDASTDFLVTNTSILQNHGFPPPTVDRAKLNWTLQMWVQNRIPRRVLRPAPERIPFDLNIDMQDAGGLEFASVPQAGPNRLDIKGTARTEDIATYLGNCQGLLMLIDPMRERESGDAYNFFFGPLLRMAQDRRVPAGQRLPHYIAVCVTKFDDPVVYEFARDHGYLSYQGNDPVMLPRVHPDNAEQFMRHLFQGLPASDIDLVAGGLRQYFYPDRIRYFIGSSVGFFVGPSGYFQEDDYRNVAQDETGKSVIRGAVRPVNVAEPLMWLGERMAAEGQP